jgi:hypothetical protein
MRKLAVLLSAAAALSTLPAAARAGTVLEGSLGLGWDVSPDTQRQPINIMLAPGLTFADDILCAELGLVGNLGDVKDSKFDLELRPMLLIRPPVFPLYFRAVLAVTNLVHSPRHVAYGGAVGTEFGVGGVGLFIEAGVLPRSISDQMLWVIEGRAGARFTF